MLGYEETLLLLQKAKNGDNEAKGEIIKQNSPLVKSIVRRYKNKGVEYDDLFQLGCVGMTKAINNFDASFNVKFSTYAVPMIAGEIKRFLRDDGSIKVSRSIKHQYYNISKYIDEVRNREDKSPTIKELTDKFHIDENELMFILESSKMPISIYDQIDKNDSGGALLVDRIASVDEQDELINKIIKEEFV